MEKKMGDEGSRKMMMEEAKERKGFRQEKEGGEIFNTFLSFNFIFRNACARVCMSYLRASTLASESASRIPFLMLSTRTAVCLQGIEKETQKVH